MEPPISTKAITSIKDHSRKLCVIKKRFNSELIWELIFKKKPNKSNKKLTMEFFAIFLLE